MRLPRWHLLVKNLLVSAGDTGDRGLIPGLGRSSAEGNGKLIPVFLPGNIPWTEEPGGPPSMGSQESDTT